MIAREQNRTEQNLFKTCTKYIVLFIYNITNIVMSCDKYTETETEQNRVGFCGDLSFCT